MTASPTVIRFLLVSHLHGIMFNPARKEALQFTSKNPEVRISIESESQDNELLSGFCNLVCKVRCELPADSNLVMFVQGLENGCYVDVPEVPLRLPVCKDGVEYIDASGRIQEGILVHLNHYPLALQDLCGQARKQLQEKLERFIRLIRWRQNIDAPHLIAEWSPSLYFCVDGPQHIVVPEPNPQSPSQTRSPKGIKWAEKNESSVRDLWISPNATEPLGHELLREAVALYGSAPRSSLIMTSTALEVGVKDHISRSEPVTSWLLLKMPSPPIFNLLRDYLPSIHKENPSIQDWKALKPLWTMCQKIAEARNQLVHSGKNPDNDALTGYICAVHDVLYILDVLDGHDWASDFVSSCIREQQGWPDPSEPEITIMLQSISPLDSPDRSFRTD
jgi:hypothetical protein